MANTGRIDLAFRDTEAEPSASTVSEDWSEADAEALAEMHRFITLRHRGLTSVAFNRHIMFMPAETEMV